MTTENPVEVLGTDECWDLLRGEEFARLAYRLVDEVHLVPINYLVEGDGLLMRTGSGGKLLAAALDSDVALEIDWHDDRSAWSVVVRGRLHRLEDHEHHRLDGLPQQSWVPTPKDDVVELVPAEITGRRFQLERRSAP